VSRRALIAPVLTLLLGGCEKIVGIVDTQVAAEPVVDAGVRADQSSGSTNGLVAWWRFDETSGAKAADSSGNRNDGTLSGAPAWGPGRIDGALSFDGLDDSVRVPESPSLALTSAMTVAAWAKLEDVPNVDQRILVKVDSWEWKLNARLPQLASPVGYATFAGPLELGRWHHLAFTFDAGAIKGFLDGKVVSLQANTFRLGTALENVASGLFVGSDGSSFCKGALDDVRIYDRALGEDEIRALAQ